MNPDELRRLAQSEPERRRQESIVQGLAVQARQIEKLWEQARKAVAEIDNTVRQAASEGRFSAVVYTARGGTYDCSANRAQGPILNTRVVKQGWFQPKTCVTSIIFIPDFAQFVFDSCPSNLNPRWEAFDTSEWIERQGFMSHGSSGITLVVSW